MKSSIFFLCLAVSGLAAQQISRPKITGVSHVAFFTSHPEDARKFYRDLLGLEPGNRADLYQVGVQSVELENEPTPHPPNMMAHVAFATDDVEAMRKFLSAHEVAVPDRVHEEKNGTQWFACKDPEGHDIEFIHEKAVAAKNARRVSSQLIHAGFAVRDRAVEDKFYRDLLGFKLYWHGGMNDSQTDWVDMQVPDGRQWLEYMIVPAKEIGARESGIVNHIALGVPDLKAAVQKLEARGWKPSDQSHLQIGRDGKWQLNLYDPDGTRVELMEFHPVEKPCCAPYTGAHPEGGE
jgi:catechol 2,3-dioxygenase-like lactoylglutathione lyase family enzyme